MRLAWATDVHLDFVSPGEADAFTRLVAGSGADALLLGGDIGEAPDVEDRLEALAAAFGRPIYFVLGNHDFYRGSIARVRAAIEALCARSPRLNWLPRSGVVPLTAETGLVGHDGWADGRCGDYAQSDVLLNDYFLIEELSGLDAGVRLQRLQALGDEAAAHFRATLPEALDRFRRLIVLTHPPPFPEACWYEGSLCDENWLPHFTCRAAGEVLSGAIAPRPDREMIVLCGHTHSPGEAQILPNLLVISGGAEYSKPALQRILLVD